MWDKRTIAVIVVAALGYFVDVYDLILFSVVRVQSLQSLGFEGEALLSNGVYLINMQMIGMLLGGVFWGILGDKRGRVSVLFGSIILYSLANIANGLVHSIEGYAFWRLIAGIGLAGELGAGITLVSEMMPPDKRGYGTTIIATVGVMGAVVAALSGQYFDWRTNYFIGGAMGLALLFLRITVTESGLFNDVKKLEVARGSLFLLLSSKARVFRYIFCIMCGLPIWFAIGVLITFSPEIASALNVTEKVSSGTAVMYAYIGLVFGDLSSGLLSQYLKSRVKVIYIFLGLTALFCGLILNAVGSSAQTFYMLCLPLGFAVGYWAMFVTIAAEQFGTNLRATVATSVPNFVRGSAVPITYLFRELIPYTGIIASAGIVATLCVILGFFAASRLKESFGANLDYIEH